MRKLFTVLFLTGWMFYSVLYGQTEKQQLTSCEYDMWEHIDHPQISKDGKWASYEVNPNEGDGTFYLVNLSSGEKKSYPRGSNARFSSENNYLVFSIKPPFQMVRKAKTAHKKSNEMPVDSLGIWDLKSGQLKLFPQVKSYKTSQEGKEVVAFLQVMEMDSVAKNAKKQSRLIVYDSPSARPDTFPYITEYEVSQAGGVVAMLKSLPDTTLSRVAVRRPAGKKNVLIFSGKGKVSNLKLDKKGEQCAFLFSKDTTKIKKYSLWYSNIKQGPANSLDLKKMGHVQESWFPSVNGKIYFSDQGARLYFGTAPLPDAEPKDTIPENEKIDVEVWSWKDPLLQPQQKVQLSREKKRTWLAVFHTKEGKVVQLAEEKVPQVTLSDKGDGRYLLGSSNLPYRKLISWESPAYYDRYIIDVQTGKKEKVLTKKQGYASLSPSGAYLIWYDNSDSLWYVRKNDGGKRVALNRNLKVPFYDELHDTPNRPSSYGIAGWLKNEKRVLVYDRYDIWSFDPEGIAGPVNLTAQNGRDHHEIYRYINTDKEKEYIPAKGTWLLSYFNEEYKSSGFASLTAGKPGLPEKLKGGAYRYKFVAKAKDAGTLLWTRESYTVSPDIWKSDLAFGKTLKLSSINPWQKDYTWGSAELIHYPDANGDRTQGLLMKPDDFSPDKTYPMIVYFYDRQSDELYKYHGHYAHRSVIVPTLYTSNGYLVFMPDIKYRTGYPGEDCFNAVVPGTQYLIQQGFVDKNRIGVMGQSWGGYQVAYLITQTDIFSACVSGAPVSDMISAYGGIRWGSGMSRMMQYEQGQSRIGGTLWEKPVHYIMNSPVYFADKINTPLLIRHDDKDGAVPWYQGIEYFVALRRLNKPVWMLNYTGGDHLLVRWSRKKDFAIRMKQFFDHYLKDTPAPEWMEKGIPAIEKGKTLGY